MIAATRWAYTGPGLALRAIDHAEPADLTGAFDAFLDCRRAALDHYRTLRRRGGGS
ncbi:hypothetical protein OHB12_00900 [Nocardia sp. NBC_01730]|uniref:hypothetical protein n=1 Tax=Nocardia sp. NBC_01730 TaxID=2975998 RepID=UPI002E12B216|nr:hypothetical protein OHB12_00900 [Nocardia sp. NBC_01730]